MKDFDDFLIEKLIVFGKRAYPQFNNVLIVAGGAGSGKGFQNSNLFGIEGKVLDVDALKMMAIKSDKFATKVKEETGQDIKTFDLRQPENVSKIHEILANVFNLTHKSEQALFSSIMMAHPDRKPNLIFDVTLKSMSKLESITRNVRELGYLSENVHIVWVVNDITVAREQNKNRSRVVSDEILLDTHQGAAITFKKILDMGDDIQKYMNGDIYISFNKAGVDVDIKKSASGGHFVSAANYFHIKKQGQKQASSNDLAQDVYDKIKEYTPHTDNW